ncbi:ATP-binding protein [Endozoicomonas sp. YOMI1]|uniref:ATP-binding protein n=1 Tax=Endozoicomonas sp. YOMI1 TaxID=2828739 RepID=UPI002147C65C|nr:ATP-binding protein [Endozoicomonas sp. YOMI1]
MINTSVNQNPTPPFGTAAEPVSVNEENSIKHISKPNTQSGKEVTIVSEVNPNVGKHQVQHEDVFGVDLIQRMCDRVGGLKQAAWEVYEKVIYPYQLLMQGVPVTPQKGIILYGPPGTGKSLLASRIVQAMGVKEIIPGLLNLQKFLPTTPSRA